MSKKQTGKPAQARRTFTEDFKRGAVNLVVVEGYSFQRAADAVGVCSKSVREWHQKYAPEAAATTEESMVQQLQQENKRLRKALEQAELERNILKKATAYFAKESQ